MTNGKGRVVTFDTKRAAACRDCTKACDEACPMRLPTRSHKRAKFSCTQCLQCVSACREVQKDNPEGSLLTWEPGEPGKQTVLIPVRDRKSTRLNSSHVRITYAVFGLQKKMRDSD